MTPSEEFKAKIYALESVIEDLREELSYYKDLATPKPPEKAHIFMDVFTLTRARASVLAALYAAYPRVLSRDFFEQNMPKTKGAGERDCQLHSVFAVHISHVRAVIGFEMIDNAWGRGWRLSSAGKALIDAKLAEAGHEF